MSYFVKPTPDNIETPPHTNMKWTWTMKIIVAVLAFLLYLILLISANAIYTKQQHLDRMDEVVLKTEEKMHKLHALDRSLAIQLERIENMVYDEEEEEDDVTTEY